MSSLWGSAPLERVALRGQETGSLERQHKGGQSASAREGKGESLQAVTMVAPRDHIPQPGGGGHHTPSGLLTESLQARSQARGKSSPTIAARSSGLSAAEMDDLLPGTLVTPENVHTFANAQVLVRTTDSYRQALAPVPDPAAQCVGIVIKVHADQCDKKGNGLRVDVLWDNGRPMQGYRVAFAKAFDLEAAEAAEPRDADSNPERTCHDASSEVSAGTHRSPKKSLWKRMAKLSFKSPFSSKSDSRHSRHSWPTSSPKFAPMDAGDRSLDSGMCSVSVGYLNVSYFCKGTCELM
jgi:hypothetical protein